MSLNTWPRDRSMSPGGGLSTGPGGGLYTGYCEQPYRSNQPPRAALLEYLARTGRQHLLQLLIRYG
ncbi:hypothetical protein HV824_09765 [Myxococcus sp. AM009]|uniref:hypothetical protein n=1 Tax=Myxococcus sp. AM009 TaxID=2745137 RepID=UPI0015961301|nr:hypothetical protein [Myxococcus sp. AM009]NVI98408.1 hypothetical protein [Myxococcus sp. AM009]